MVARAVQSEWIFLQRVTKDMVQAFTGLELFLQETFSPRISLENQNSPSNHSRSKYISGKEIRTGPTGSRDISKV